jgi:hypothetical protein
MGSSRTDNFLYTSLDRPNRAVYLVGSHLPSLMAKFVKHSRNAQQKVEKPTKGQSDPGFAQLITSLKRKQDQIDKSTSIVASRKAR